MDYKKTIKKIVDILKVYYRPQTIILFGSCVYGRVKESSDIDMLIVKRTKKPYAQRWLEVGRLVRKIEKALPFEPFILTPQELQRQLKRNLFLREVIKRGKLLYEKPRLF